jgi:peptidoglycan/LPS O-acetylase OafA/YrhL
MKTPILTSLQTMRLFASLGVAQYHLWQNYFGIAIAHPGTDFFLVLVGVVAAYTQAKRIPGGNWWGYISARYKRLYVTFVPLFIITLLAKWAEADINWVLRSFFFIPIADQVPVIGCTWMLSMFILFYFVFSLCFLIKTEKILWIVFVIWTTLIMIYNLFNWETGLPEHWANLFFAARNFDFIMGYVVGIVLRYDWLRSYQSRIFLWIGLVGVIGGTILLNSGFNTVGRVLIVGLPVALFILGIAALEQKNANDSIVRLLTTPCLVWLGGTSYVLYLSHGLYFQVWSRVLPVTLMWVLPMTVGAIVVGALGYIFWEHPVLTYLKSGKWIIAYSPVMNIGMEDKIQRDKTGQQRH